MVKETMTWDGAADAKLLLAILASHEIKLDYASVAVAVGHPCSAMAVQKRLQKLKGLAKSKEDGNFISSSGTTKSKTSATKPTSSVKPPPKKRETVTNGVFGNKPAASDDNGKPKAKRAASEMQNGNAELVNNKKVKFEKGSDDEDDQSAREYDPPSDQLMAEMEASQASY